MSENAIYVVENPRRHATLATRLRIAGTSAERRRGLLDGKSLQKDEGLWIAPCEAIHTIGMRWPIDVIFIDRRYRVRKIAANLAPWRMTLCWSAFSVLELPAGAAASSETQIGDFLTFHPTSP